MAKETQNSMWLGRPIVSQEHANDLEIAAAANEFDKGMSRHDAESKAHDDYIRDQRLSAAAHHLSGIKASQGSGDLSEAQKHGALYQLHLKALGLDPMGPVPPEVQAKMNAPDRKKIYGFKAHAGDLFALSEAQSQPAQPQEHEPLGKSESSGCEWSPAVTTGKQCKNPCSRKVGKMMLCHWHADMAAKKEFKKKPTEYPKPDSLSKAEGQKNWVGRDGLEIPKHGTPERDSWNKRFLKAAIQGLGLGFKPKAVQVKPSETTPRNAPVNSARLDLYKKMAKAGEPLPPIAVERTAHGWYVTDGNHRIAAHSAVNGDTPIEALDITPPGSYYYQHGKKSQKP